MSEVVTEPRAGAPSAAPAPAPAVAPAGLRTLVSSTDLDETREIISSAYSPYDLSVLRGHRDFSAWYAEGGFDGITVSGLSYGAETLVAPEPLTTYLLVCQVVHGRVKVLSPRKEERVIEAGEIYVLDPYRTFRVHWQPGARMVTIRLARDLVEQAAADSLGIEAPVRARFTLGAAVSSRAGRTWGRIASAVQREVEEGGIALTSPLVATSLSQAAAAALVETHPLITDGVDVRPTGVVPHAAVRRAMAFMDDFANQPITLGDIARAARVSPRALQEAFRRHLGTTPLGHLRDVRLRRAHQDLVTASRVGGVSVTHVAQAWGFSNLGRFSALYQRRYGQPPSRTLRG